MGIPHRFDLHENSCVNKEIEVFNSKLGKLVKAFRYAALIKPDSDREVFTRHGQHMNNKGKDLVLKKIMSALRHVLDKKEIEEPVIMTWKEEEDRVITLQGKHNNQIYKGEGKTLEVNKEKLEIQD
jgi:hypothetical protein